MAYESPIELTIKQMQESMEINQEKAIINACYEVGVRVDKDELIKALEYDRDQYKKGIEDGKRVLERMCKYRREWYIDGVSKVICANPMMADIEGNPSICTCQCLWME